MVLKNRLWFFPPVGQLFDLDDGQTTVQARVDAEPCACRGPEKPHEHYFIRRQGLAKGQRLTIRREEDGQRYSLTVS
jgi:hypothetical protein